ncbi:MAG: translation initiation factor IF-2 [Actinomycetota bacterium]|nr:translation initiation factor IF-2 [Actinomycetota bacterium]
MAKTESKKIRIHEIAKELGLDSSKRVLIELERLGVTGKTASSSIEEDVARKVKDVLAAKIAEKAAAATAKQAAVSGAPGAAEEPRKKEKPAAEAPSAAQSKAGGQVVAEPPVQEQQEVPAAAGAETAETALPEEETELKVPDRFKKDVEAERLEKFKAKPQMQRAFQTIRKIEPRKFHDPKLARKPGAKPPVAAGARGPGRVEKPQAAAAAPRKRVVKLLEGATVKEFAELIGVKATDVIRKFMEMGYMPTINNPVDPDAAILVADVYGIKLEPATAEDEAAPEEQVQTEDTARLEPRPPVVTIMGHVDHGKTTLLDSIRKSSITAGEAGGITQHIGAYKVKYGEKEIAFLDTPGHEAFTTLRARGAKATDIVVLVVAADDGVKPQTIEAVDHAKAAGVPIIVAVNKIDKPEANPQRVRNELSELGIVSEEWGGQSIFADISAKKNIGIDNLLEMILLQAEVMELKANPNRMAKGVIIESRLDKGKGPLATILVQSGTLRIGDVFLSGVNAGRVRAMSDESGARIEKAGPSTPVEVVGFGSVPNAGDGFVVLEDERKARQIALSRLQKMRPAEAAAAKKLTLDELYSRIKEGQIKDLNIVIKGDAQGSIEALRGAFGNITHPEVKVRVIHSSIGGINESDVMLAAASSAIIIGFNVRPEIKAQQLAEKEGVDIRLYNIIYEAVDNVKKALEGMLEPTVKEKVLGRAEVRQTFAVSRIGTIAGCMVINGTMNRTSDGIRVIRDNIVVYEGKIGSLKRFKEDVKEVQTGYECGITIENFNDLKVGDILENFVMEKIAAKL